MKKTKKKFGAITAWIADYTIDDRKIMLEQHADHPEIGQMRFSVFGANDEMSENEVWEAYRKNRFRK